MKKVLLAVLLILCTICSCLNAAAITFYEYGDVIFSLPMTGSLSDMMYWYFYKGKESSEITTEKAYEGKTALRCDIDSLNASDLDVPLVFHTNKINTVYGLQDNDVCFEIYTNGCESIAGSLTFVVYCTQKDGTEKNYKNFVSEATEKDGWVRNYCVLSAAEIKETQSFHIGIIYDKDTAASGEFYIDNINIKICPVSIKANDAISSKRVVDLEEIRLFGYDINSVQKEIQYNNFLKWNFVSGDAEIHSGKLIFNDLTEKTVTVEVDFMGRKNSFSIILKPELIYSQPVLDGNKVKINIFNNGNLTRNIRVYVMVFNGTELYSVKTLNQTVMAGENKEVVSNIRVPAKFENSSVKVMCCDSVNGNNIYVCN